MLATRIVTALILVAAVLAALFLLPPWAWGAVALAGIAVAAGEWASLAGYGRPAWLLFVAGALLIGINLLLSPLAGFAGGWPEGEVAYHAAFGGGHLQGVGRDHVGHHGGGQHSGPDPTPQPGRQAQSAQDLGCSGAPHQGGGVLRQVDRCLLGQN